MTVVCGARTSEADGKSLSVRLQSSGVLHGVRSSKDRFCHLVGALGRYIG